MEFKRIDKDTVNCIITEDDMFEQGIKLEDLFEKKKEAMDFLHEVMKKAEEEVDYKPTGSFMPLQITVLPDHSVSLTLSENASASFSEILKNLTDKGVTKEYGAREIERIINNDIKPLLVNEILFGKLKKGGPVTIKLDEGKFKI